MNYERLDEAELLRLSLSAMNADRDAEATDLLKVLLERERDQLQVKFSALTAPERIAKVATDKLGLTPPQQGQVFIIHPQPAVPVLATPSVEQVRVARSMPTPRGEK